MKRSLTAVCLAAVMASAAFAEPISREVGEFRAIEIQDGVRLDISIAAAQAVSVVAVDGDPNKLLIREFLPWIVFNRDMRWFIFPKWRDDVLQVSVETPVLNGLKAFEGAQATFSGDADERLWIETGTGGVITLSDIAVEELTLVARGGGTIVASGTCEQLTIRNQGFSVDASGLQCDSIVVNGDDTNISLPAGATVVAEHPEITG